MNVHMPLKNHQHQPSAKSNNQNHNHANSNSKQQSQPQPQSQNQKQKIESRSKSPRKKKANKILNTNSTPTNPSSVTDAVVGLATSTSSVTNAAPSKHHSTNANAVTSTSTSTSTNATNTDKNTATPTGGGLISNFKKSKNRKKSFRGKSNQIQQQQQFQNQNQVQTKTQSQTQSQAQPQQRKKVHVIEETVVMHATNNTSTANTSNPKKHGFKSSFKHRKAQQQQMNKNNSNRNNNRNSSTTSTAALDNQVHPQQRHDVTVDPITPQQEQEENGIRTSVSPVNSTIFLEDSAFDDTNTAAVDFHHDHETGVGSEADANVEEDIIKLDEKENTDKSQYGHPHHRWNKNYPRGNKNHYNRKEYNKGEGNENPMHSSNENGVSSYNKSKLSNGVTNKQSNNDIEKKANKIHEERKERVVVVGEVDEVSGSGSTLEKQQVSLQDNYNHNGDTTDTDLVQQTKKEEGNDEGEETHQLSDDKNTSSHPTTPTNNKDNIVITNAAGEALLKRLSAGNLVRSVTNSTACLSELTSPGIIDGKDGIGGEREGTVGSTAAATKTGETSCNHDETVSNIMIDVSNIDLSVEQRQERDAVSPSNAYVNTMQQGVLTPSVQSGGGGYYHYEIPPPPQQQQQQWMTMPPQSDLSHVDPNMLPPYMSQQQLPPPSPQEQQQHPMFMASPHQLPASFGPDYNGMLQQQHQQQMPMMYSSVPPFYNQCPPLQVQSQPPPPMYSQMHSQMQVPEVYQQHHQQHNVSSTTNRVPLKYEQVSVGGCVFFSPVYKPRDTGSVSESGDTTASPSTIMENNDASKPMIPDIAEIEKNSAKKENASKRGQRRNKKWKTYKKKSVAKKEKAGV